MIKSPVFFNKTLVIGIIVLFIGMSITSSVAIDDIKKSPTQISKGNTLYVGGTGYTKIPDPNVSYVSSLLWGNCRDIKVMLNYAYCVLTNGLVVLDITDPSNPIILNELYIHTYAGKIDINGSYIYMASSDIGLQIIDVHDPGNPQLVATCDTPGSAVDVFIADNFAYIGDWNAGLQIIDVSDPENPSLAGNYSEPGCCYKSVFVSGDYAYVGDCASDLMIFDISDPYYPILASTFIIGHGVRSIWVEEPFAYVLCRDDYWGQLLLVIYIENPESPYLSCKFILDAESMFLVDDILYVAFCYWGLRIYDISNPCNPVFLGECNVTGPGFGFEYDIDVFVHNNYAYMACLDGGLHIIDVSDLNNPVVVRSSYSCYIRTCFVKGNYVYVANYDKDGCMNVINVSDPYHPEIVGYVNLNQGNALEIYVQENYAYIANSDLGLQIVNVSYPSNPFLISQHEVSHEAYDVFVVGDIAYIANGVSLVIFNVSDQFNPVLISDFNYTDNPHHQARAYGLYVKGNYVYIADSEYGLVIVNVSDPYDPCLVAIDDLPCMPYDLFVSGDYAYLADRICGLQIIDVLDPFNTSLVATYETDVPGQRGHALEVFVSGNYTYIADIYTGVHVVNIADPSTPFFAGRYSTPGETLNLFVNENLIYVDDRYSLMILEFNEPDNYPPFAPVITGPTDGKAGVEYEYNFSLSDPDDDKMHIRVDWGSGTPGKWDGPFPSGSIIKYNYSWRKKGTYIIKAQTQDCNGLLSDWGTLTITIPRNKESYSPWFIWFLERFPILEKLLGLIKNY